MTRPYPDVVSKPSIPDLEREVLVYWETDDTFRSSVEQHPRGRDEFVFYDGPPFANGLPHYGHILTGFVKDVVPRYQTMRGRRVERRFGWDCHGLPAEMAAETELGLKDRAAVLDYGVDRFTEQCRTSVMRYTREWERYVTRQARWVDFANDYKTMDPSYTESVMWAFKELWRKGLVYEGHRVLPYCWECETPQSNFETRLDDAYRDRTDQTLTVQFELLDEPLALLVWTTTPWTLPSNLALAVGRDVDYAILEQRGQHLVLAEPAVERYAELADARRVGSMKGAELAGARYRPLFDFFAGVSNAFRVLEADFVTAEDGTGIVHMAPGFGEDDQRLCEANGIAVVCPVDDVGRFTWDVPPYAGMHVFDANEAIARDLGDAVWSAEPYVHSYPHCWRTDTPLIYRAVSSWFVRVTALRDQILELNREITWVPEHVRDGAFGKWLEGARDWAISRNRFWGAPIPVWRSDDPAYSRIDVYGSLDELEEDFGVRPDDLHRPWIDELTRPNPDDPTGASTMRRVPEVLDCWFESGSMPFAQVHYPFENREWFEDHFPADFVVEYVGQARAWFYTMHVMATALFDRPAFRAAVAHGVVLGPDGRKLSKRLRNFPDPEEMFDTAGSDAMRWCFLSSSVLRAQDLVVDRAAIHEAQRTVLLPLWNLWRFFATYANADGEPGRYRTDSQHPLDRYALARTRGLVSGLRERLDAYDFPGACALARDVVDALTNWYVRRSRDRFWTSDSDARDTLYTVLHVLLRAVAPLLPLVTEAIYRPLTGERSVHLADYPTPEQLPDASSVVASMEATREICTAGHGIREAHGRRVRLPLPELVVATPAAERLDGDLIADELNVKSVVLTSDVDAYAERVLQIELSVAAPRLGRHTREVLEAARGGNWTLLEDGRARVGGHFLLPGEFDARLQARDAATSRVLAHGRGVVVLDVRPTPALEAEGVARDVVRLVQQARRAAGLDVTDRIRLRLEAPEAVIAAVEVHVEHVRRETLATEVTLVRGRDTTRVDVLRA